jgi:hypothetical protein
MTNDKRNTTEDTNTDPDLVPDTPAAADEVNPAKDGRSLDLGESGQFAPGGYYNQHGVAEDNRIDLDEQVADALKNKP